MQKHRFSAKAFDSKHLKEQEIRDLLAKNPKERCELKERWEEHGLWICRYLQFFFFVISIISIHFGQNLQLPIFFMICIEQWISMDINGYQWILQQLDDMYWYVLNTILDGTIPWHPMASPIFRRTKLKMVRTISAPRYLHWLPIFPS